MGTDVMGSPGACCTPSSYPHAPSSATIFPTQHYHHHQQQQHGVSLVTPTPPPPDDSCSAQAACGCPWQGSQPSNIVQPGVARIEEVFPGDNTGVRYFDVTFENPGYAFDNSRRIVPVSRRQLSPSPNQSYKDLVDTIVNAGKNNNSGATPVSMVNPIVNYVSALTIPLTNHSVIALVAELQDAASKATNGTDVRNAMTALHNKVKAIQRDTTKITVGPDSSAAIQVGYANQVARLFTTGQNSDVLIHAEVVSAQHTPELKLWNPPRIYSSMAM